MMANLEYKQLGVEANGVNKIHQKFLKIIQVFSTKSQTVVDGLYFNRELTEVSISFVIGKTINKG